MGLTQASSPTIKKKETNEQNNSLKHVKHHAPTNIARILISIKSEFYRRWTTTGVKKNTIQKITQQ